MPSISCWNIDIGPNHFDGGAMFGTVPKELWSRWVESDENNHVKLTCRCVLVRSDDAVILYDTGIGSFMEPKWAERYGVKPGQPNLIDRLKEIGISEEDVGIVVLSHLHFDHAGGLLPRWPGTRNKKWQPAFPKARYIAGSAQLERAAHPHRRDRASYTEGLVDQLSATGRLRTVEPSAQSIPELPDSISFRWSNGHTPGLLQLLIKGNNETIFLVSDMIPGTAWLHLPVTMGYDRNPEQLVDEKERVLKEAVNGNWILVYPHDPLTAASRIMIDHKGRYAPTEPVKTIEGMKL